MSTSSTASASVAAAVTKAVPALLNWKDSQSSNKKLQLIPDDEFIYLILTLKKIPAKPRTNAYKIPLPHPLHSSADLCLIIDDRPGSKPTSESIKEIIKAQNIPVTKVIKLSKLKSNYKPFEAKRKLCGSYDLFLADKRILHFLPKLLGRTFFKKKKIPVPVDMAKNWKGKVEKAGSSGLLYFRTGTCCVMKVGKRGMEREEIEENVKEMIERVVEFVPKQWGGVRSFHLKFGDSVALPVYQALPDLKMRIEGVREEGREEEIDVSLEGVGSEKKSGGKKKEKGRIHEVRYMDDGLIEDGDVDGQNEVVVSDAEGEKSGEDEFAGKKRKKGVVEDEVNENEIKEAGVNKVKKGRGVTSDVVTPMDVEKPAKKGRKGEKLEVAKPKEVIIEEENKNEVNENESKDDGVKKAKKGRRVKSDVTLMDVEKPAKKGRKGEKLVVVKPKEVIIEEENKKIPIVAKKATEKSITQKKKEKKNNLVEVVAVKKDKMEVKEAANKLDKSLTQEKKEKKSPPLAKKNGKRGTMKV